MRIVQVTPTPFGSGGILGGGERYPLELSRALAREVTCRLITFGRRPAAYQEAGGLHVQVIPAIAFLNGHPAHPIGPGLPLAIAGADVVHTHQMRSTPAKLAAISSRVRRRRVVVTDHGLQGSDWGGRLQRLFDLFLPVSSFSAAEMAAPHARTRVIFGGADTERFSPEPATDRDGVLFVGRLTPHKGIDRLIAAMPPGATLHIAGTDGHDPHPPENGYLQLLRHAASGRDVRFLGPVSDDQLPSLYRSASVLALPSVHETCYGRTVRVSELLGLVAIEAMASGTPVVCSRLDGLPEVVQDGLTGFLVEPGNVEELRDRLAQLIGDRGLAEWMGRNAREAAVARFTWRACAERCLAAYEELLRPAARGRAA